MQVDDLQFYLKCHSSTAVFKHFASKKQLPGLSVSGTLVENGLMGACPFEVLQNILLKISTPGNFMSSLLKGVRY